MDATLDREEGRHAIVIRDYLTVTRAVDPFALERERMAHVSRGYYPAAADNPLDGLVYVTLQELATRIAHRNTGVASSDRIAAAGIYDLPIHHDQVLAGGRPGLPEGGAPQALTGSCRSWLTHKEVIMRGIAVLAVAGLTLVASGTASAQQRMIMGDMITASGTVEKIDKANRQVTLKGADGEQVTVEVSKEAKRFDEVKVGDTVTITYADAVVVRLKKPDEKSVNTLETEEVAGDRERPGGYRLVKRTITATIQALDPSVPSVTFAGPGDWKYTRRIRDPEILEQVKAGKIKVGDRVDFTWYLAADITVK